MDEINKEGIDNLLSSDLSTSKTFRTFIKNIREELIEKESSNLSEADKNLIDVISNKMVLGDLL